MSGLVQGVGFRVFVRDRARALGIAGWIRNTEDGDVEVMAKGEEGALKLLGIAVREGPPGARVDRVTPIEFSVIPEYPEPFRIIP